MFAAARIAVFAAAFAASACGAERQQPDAGNVGDANSPAEVEALPADESSATSSAELANGVNEPDVGELGNQH